jgi:hypothetical protein
MLAEVRNQADTAIYTAGKPLQEHGSRMTDAGRRTNFWLSGRVPACASQASLPGVVAFQGNPQPYGCSSRPDRAASDPTKSSGRLRGRLR